MVRPKAFDQVIRASFVLRYGCVRGAWRVLGG
jgi:hypothetical protein